MQERVHSSKGLDPILERCYAGTQQFAQCAVLIIGDIMLDEYLFGQAERISPEAPVPVVLVDDSKLVVGGAGNVARNIRALGATAMLASIVGDDSAGATVTDVLASEGIEATLEVMGDRPTTCKTRVLAAGQQMLRIDKELAAPMSCAQADRLLASIAPWLAKVQAIVVSDYGKGVVTPYLMEGLRRLVDDDGRNLPVLVDPKPNNAASYHHVRLMTPNKKETGELSGIVPEGIEATLAAGTQLQARFQCQDVVITLGAQGMAVFEESGAVWHIPTVAQSVFDVTGAGDTVIATLALALAAGESLVEASITANHAAGIVVGKIGAATVSLDVLQKSLQSQAFSLPQQWR